MLAHLPHVPSVNLICEEKITPIANLPILPLHSKPTGPHCAGLWATHMESISDSKCRNMHAGGQLEVIFFPFVGLAVLPVAPDEQTAVPLLACCPPVICYTSTSVLAWFLVSLSKRPSKHGTYDRIIVEELHTVSCYHCWGPLWTFKEKGMI